MKFHPLPICLVVASYLAAHSSIAADFHSPMQSSVPQTMETSGNSGWSASLAPYFWAAGLSGELCQFGLPRISLDASFSDVLDVLDFGFMASGEVRNGRYSVLSDLIYTKVSGQSGTPRGLLGSSVEVSSETFAGLLGIGYAVFDDDHARVDAIGGLRLWSVESELVISGGGLDGRARMDEATWLDGLVGLRGTYLITPEVYLTGWGFIGAGGAKLDWDVATAVGYHFSDSVSATIGYRALGVDYGKDGFLFDIVQQGPMLGLAIRF